jgi:hypothetical protein
MCFVVVAVWSFFAATLYGSDPSRLYFLDDWVNVLNYFLLCPLYIGFGAVLVAASVQGHAYLKELLPADRIKRALASRYRTWFLSALAILAAACAVNIKFMTEVMNPSIYPRVYWFMDQPLPDGTRVLGAFGFYYGLLNFCLGLFSLVVAVIFLSEFRVVVEIGASIDRLNSASPMSTELLRHRLTTFTQVYLAGKLAVASYMANALAWKTSQAHHSVELLAYGGALTLFGVVFLSIPRYYVELQWFRLRTATRGAAEAAPEYEDLRPWVVDFVGTRWSPKLVASTIDALMISGFISSFFL